VEEAVAYFGARYEVNTIDGVRIAFPDGWGLLRASNTQPVLVLRFEATSEEALARYRREVFDWLAARDIQA
jgi:phosphomannomutase/phosphoglucomutase